MRDLRRTTASRSRGDALVPKFKLRNGRCVRLVKLQEVHLAPVVRVVPLAVHLEAVLALAHELLPVHRRRTHGSISPDVVIKDVQRDHVLARTCSLRFFGVGRHVFQCKSFLVVFIGPDGV